ncbi:MAG: cytochrome b5 domain-containing protein, partial [Nanoarchaeota archaeon]|nr:cytochrome b5 domain-containing protein [Nanoarchaeota archaeon]
MRKNGNFALLIPIVIILGILILAFAVFIYLNKTSVEFNNSTGSGLSPLVEITLKELEIHNSLSDCWINYRDKIYDITKWVGNNPEFGEYILPYCGDPRDFEGIQMPEPIAISTIISESQFRGNFG